MMLLVQAAGGSSYVMLFMVFVLGLLLSPNNEVWRSPNVVQLILMFALGFLAGRFYNNQASFSTTSSCSNPAEAAPAAVHGQAPAVETDWPDQGPSREGARTFYNRSVGVQSPVTYTWRHQTPRFTPLPGNSHGCWRD